MKMTLDEAIQHCREKEDCSLCGEDHRQLRLWLEDYKRIKEHIDQMPKRHGRLIDENQVLERIRQNIDYIPWPEHPWIMLNWIEQIINSCDTIVEAEDGE